MRAQLPPSIRSSKHSDCVISSGTTVCFQEYFSTAQNKGSREEHASPVCHVVQSKIAKHQLYRPGSDRLDRL
jgi:hypothetical protein